MDDRKYEALVDLLAGEILRQREELALSKARVRDLERALALAEAALPEPDRPRPETRRRGE